MTNLMEVWKNLPASLQCDKGFPHAYLYVYSLLLDSYKDKPITMCEVGVAGGQSMKMWDTFFTHPDTKIYGLDINLKQVPAEVGESLSSRCVLISSDCCVMEKTALNELKFDFVIDDGSHSSDHQKVFFEFFKPKLKENGLLIIEDILDKPTLQKLLDLDSKNFYFDTRNIHRWMLEPNADGKVHYDLIMVHHNITFPDFWKNYGRPKPTFVDMDF